MRESVDKVFFFVEVAWTLLGWHDVVMLLMSALPLKMS